MCTCGQMWRLLKSSTQLNHRQWFDITLGCVMHVSYYFTLTGSKYCWNWWSYMLTTPSTLPYGCMSQQSVIYWYKTRLLSVMYRNVRRDVTAWFGWQRSHHCHSLLTRQKCCFYKGHSLTWAHIFVVHSNIRNLRWYCKRGNISLQDEISQMKIYRQIKEKL